TSLRSSATAKVSPRPPRPRADEWMGTERKLTNGDQLVADVQQRFDLLFGRRPTLLDELGAEAALVRAEAVAPLVRPGGDSSVSGPRSIPQRIVGRWTFRGLSLKAKHARTSSWV